MIMIDLRWKSNDSNRTVYFNENSFYTDIASRSSTKLELSKYMLYLFMLSFRYKVNANMHKANQTDEFWESCLTLFLSTVSVRGYKFHLELIHIGKETQNQLISVKTN